MAEDPEKSKQFQADGGDMDISNGLVQNRGCTDVWCCGVFIAHWVGFVIVVSMGLAAGNPTKLYAPRDFQGAYCGVSSNWNDGPSTENQAYLSYTMNVSSTTDMIAKQLLCSTVARQALVDDTDSGLLTIHQENTYLCACCLTPCAKCQGSLDTGGDLTTANGLSSTISGKMGDFTKIGNAGSLADSNSFNGDFFTNMWQEATKYFNPVCLPSCDVDYTALNGATDLRSYTYEPSMDNELSVAWTKLKTSGPAQIQSTINSSFTFQALPFSTCPYNASKCVPMPGVGFSPMVEGSNYCVFKMAAETISAVGSDAAAAWDSLGGNALSNSMTDGFGEWFGHILSAIDTVILMAVLSFVVGLIFLVMLRFCVGVCVWIAVLLTILMFPLGGALAFVRSGQCAGAGFFESGVQLGVAAGTAASTAVSNAVTGVATSESMTGDGADYRGAQSVTINGYTCDDWSNHAAYATKNNTDYNGMLYMNRCRNPYKATDVNKASTIWCFTTDPDVRWEECSPIGQIQPDCKNGYAISSETLRDVLKWCAYIIWGLGIIWVIIVFCFVKRIMLAIALNKVAAQFLATNPLILTVPICQALVGVVWIVLWAFLAAFILSQVPDDYVPTQAYLTYQDAYGVDGIGFLDSGTPGNCTGTWPTGGVWKDEENCEAWVNGTETLYKCWKCFPPRYAIDQYFAYSFFSFLWANAFLIAFGQILIAAAVGAWFFSPNKGSDPIIRQGLWVVCRYHLGSVALGSFIIALIQFIRACLKYMEKQAQAQKNRVMVLVFKLVGCCVWCFEKCMKFLNKNAYIQIALLGTNFCVSAKKAFFLILRNAARFAVVAVLGQMIHAIGILCITAGTAVVGYFLIRAMHDDIPPFMPMVVFVFLGYVVSRLFMAVFGMAVDTSLQCYIATEEMGGSPNVPEVLSSTLPQVQKDAKVAEAEDI